MNRAFSSVLVVLFLFGAASVTHPLLLAKAHAQESDGGSDGGGSDGGDSETRDHGGSSDGGSTGEGSPGGGSEPTDGGGEPTDVGGEPTDNTGTPPDGLTDPGAEQLGEVTETFTLSAEEAEEVSTPTTAAERRAAKNRSSAKAKEALKAKDATGAQQIVRVIRLIEKASATCRSVAGAGQADCFGRSLARIAKAIPAKGTLARVKTAVARSAGQLNGIVRQNGQRGAKLQGFVPIRQEAVRVAATKANTVLRQLAAEIARIAPPSGATKERAQIRLLAQQVKSMKVAMR